MSEPKRNDTLGKKWGVHRYQNYPKGYDGDSKFMDLNLRNVKAKDLEKVSKRKNLDPCWSANIKKGALSNG